MSWTGRGSHPCTSLSRRQCTCCPRRLLNCSRVSLPKRQQLDNQEQLRLSLRERCQRSLYFFLKVVLGYHDMVPHLHGEVCQYLQAPKQHKLVVLPRGHLKTSICTIGYAIWRACINPSIRILISNATATNASHFIRNIGA